MFLTYGYTEIDTNTFQLYIVEVKVLRTKLIPAQRT